jgi:hypothetical protein
MVDGKSTGVDQNRHYDLLKLNFEKGKNDNEAGADTPEARFYRQILELLTKMDREAQYGRKRNPV